MEQVVPGRRHRVDLVGTQIFWATLGVTLACAIPFALLPRLRPWIGCAALLMWCAFFTANAVRSRRTHSVISAPIYLLAAFILAGSAAGLIQVQIWMVWLLGAGVIAANLSERFIGKYLGR
jgi:hypothetical protein